MDAYWAGARARIARAPSRRRLARRWSRLSLILALSSGIAAHAQVPELIVERSGGSIEVVDQSRLQIVGIRGKLTVRGGRDGEVNFMCRSVADRNEERVLGLWVDGSTLILRPADVAR